MSAELATDVAAWSDGYSIQSQMTAETPGATDMIIGTCVMHFKDATDTSSSDVICHTVANDATTSTSMAGTTATATYAHNLWLIPYASWVTTGTVVATSFSS